jgi:hypothetical protein
MVMRTAILSALLFAVSAASAQERIALVIGNSNYAEGALANPVNDARLIAATLREVGFDLIEQLDSDENAMESAIQDFGDRLENAGKKATGLFYYAGHGVQVDGVNYLIPIGAEIDHARRIKTEAVSTDIVMDTFTYARNELNIVILDACRNNPYASRTRSPQRGLSQMTAPTGTLIAYATSPGNVASDGAGDNSPYSAALADGMLRKGELIEQMFKGVRRSVKTETNGAQEPWEASSLIGDFYFNKNGQTQDIEPATIIVTAQAERETRFWLGIKDSTVVEDFQEYQRQFAGGTYQALARNRIAALRNAVSDTSSTTVQEKSAIALAKVFDSTSVKIGTRNAATKVAEKQWEWSAFIEAGPDVIEHVICVEYTLHETFTPQVRTVCDRGSDAQPYALHAVGWGTFKLRMRVMFDDGSTRRLIHQLSFKG